MGRISVESTVGIYEDHGKDVDSQKVVLIVKSHWNDSDRVRLIFGEMEITVIAADLHAAITNACNTGRR